VDDSAAVCPIIGHASKLAYAWAARLLLESRCNALA